MALSKPRRFLETALVCRLRGLPMTPASARPNFVRSVPTPFECDTCHDTPAMRQWRNGFGIDFATRRTVWATDDDWGLCDLDSDGDGIRNGDELGDPECRWRPGDRLPDVQATNPGEIRDPDRCGDDLLHPGEACDGVDLGGATCLDHGFIDGNLGCTARCELDTGDCVSPEPDAALPIPDAAPPLPDAAPPTPDAAPPIPDAAPADSGSPTPDASSPEVDSMVVSPNDAATAADGRVNEPRLDQGLTGDGGVDAEVRRTPDGGPPTRAPLDLGDPADEGGCLQNAGGPALPWWLLFVLGLPRRRASRA